MIIYCPQCGWGLSRVVHQNDGSDISPAWWRRECLNCFKIFTTTEAERDALADARRRVIRLAHQVDMLTRKMTLIGARVPVMGKVNWDSGIIEWKD